MAVLIVPLIGQVGCGWLNRRTPRDDSVAQSRGSDAWAEVDARDGGGSRLNDRWRRLVGRSDRARTRMSNDADDNDPGRYVAIAQSHFHKQQYTAAFGPLEVALELDPNYVEALILKGKLMAALGRDEAAATALHRALSVDENHPEAMLELALLHLHEGRFDRAAHGLRAVAANTRASDQQRVEAQWRVGVAYGHQQRWQECLAAFSDVSAQRELDADDHYWLALAYFRTGDIQNAQREANNATLLAPGHLGATKMLAHLQGSNVAGQILPAAAVPEGRAAPAVHNVPQEPAIGR